MAQDNKIYVVGHKNPHADSITSAIGYAAYLREKGKDAIACRAGDLDFETRYLLKRFGFEEPEYLKTAKISVGNIDLEEPISVSKDASILELLRLLDEEKRDCIAVTDDEGHVVGFAEQKMIARLALSRTEETLTMLRNTPLEYYRRALEGKILYDPGTLRLNGMVSIATHTPHDNVGGYEIEDRIVITGPREATMRSFIEKGAGLLIVVWAEKIDESILELARSKGCAVLLSGIDPLFTSRFLFYAPPVTMLMIPKPIKFFYNELAEDVEKKMAKTRYLSYPIVDEENRLKGYVNMNQIMNYKNKQIVMVDHNEFSRSVAGIEKARVLEVIDHHRVTDFKTARPVNFRNEIVGSTSTIIATMFFENQVNLDANLAGLLLGGLLTDTMDLRTPTTTAKDRKTAIILAALAGVDLDDFAKDLFSVNESANLTLEEQMNHDTILLEVGGCKIIVCKINVAELEGFKDRYDEVQKTLDNITNIKELELGVLALTSALENASVIFASGEKAEWALEAFPDKKGESHSRQEGIVSRKAQIIPALTAVVEKYA